MKFELKSLELKLLSGDIIVPFDDVSYFWGQMGAGKTSIARLVDYCLGGNIELSPALQKEFVAATLNLSLRKSSSVSFERTRDSDKIVANWDLSGEPYHLILPARDAAGEVLPATGVEVLSDLVFWLSDLTAPKVRKSKTKDDSERARLSLRDLLWYCYLDQDEIDSSFFYLDENASPWVKYKSRDVLRYVIGFHDERIAEIEAELDQLRGERMALTTTIDGLRRALKEAKVESEEQIEARLNEIRQKVSSIENEIASAKIAAVKNRQVTHAVDSLGEKARKLGEKIEQENTAITEVRRAVDRDQRHYNEVETLSLKYRRSVSARAALAGVEFHSCPRCTQALPMRDERTCRVCGQADAPGDIDPTDEALIANDAKARLAELKDVISKHNFKIEGMMSNIRAWTEEKRHLEFERNRAFDKYDSAYLSSRIMLEREQSAFEQEMRDLEKIRLLPRMIQVHQSRSDAIVLKETALRRELKDARSSAEEDSTNLESLKLYFLDCLVRSGVPGISETDVVTLPTTTFFPEVHGPSADDQIIASFSTLSSGGKKTLFKCCFAIALHRLARKLRAPLPNLLIIDSPMKNISERENRKQFEDFYRMLYELKADELKDTQIILIDKEYCPPDKSYDFGLTERHMRPNSTEFPPLLPWYEGK